MQISKSEYAAGSINFRSISKSVREKNTVSSNLNCRFVSIALLRTFTSGAILKSRIFCTVQIAERGNARAPNLNLFDNYCLLMPTLSSHISPGESLRRCLEWKAQMFMPRHLNVTFLQSKIQNIFLDFALLLFMYKPVFEYLSFISFSCLNI